MAEIGIKIDTTLELNEDSSIQNIRAQIPSIQKKLNGNANSDLLQIAATLDVDKTVDNIISDKAIERIQELLQKQNKTLSLYATIDTSSSSIDRLNKQIETIKQQLGTELNISPTLSNQTIGGNVSASNVGAVSSNTSTVNIQPVSNAVLESWKKLAEYPTQYQNNLEKLTFTDSITVSNDDLSHVIDFSEQYYSKVKEILDEIQKDGSMLSYSTSDIVRIFTENDTNGAIQRFTVQLKGLNGEIENLTYNLQQTDASIVDPETNKIVEELTQFKFVPEIIHESENAMENFQKKIVSTDNALIVMQNSLTSTLNRINTNVTAGNKTLIDPDHLEDVNNRMATIAQHINELSGVSNEYRSREKSNIQAEIAELNNLITSYQAQEQQLRINTEAITTMQNSLNAALDKVEQSTNSGVKPLINPEHIEEVNLKISEIREAIANINATSDDTFKTQQSNINKTIQELGLLINQYKNMEYAATSLRTKDVATIKLEQSQNLDRFVTTIKNSVVPMNAMQQEIDDLTEQLHKIGTSADTAKEDITDFLNSFDVARHKYQALREEFKEPLNTNADLQTAKIQSLRIAIETFLRQNPRAKQEFGTMFDGLMDDLDNITSSGDIKRIDKEFKALKQTCVDSNFAKSNFVTQLMNSLKSSIPFLNLSNAISEFISQIRQTITELVEVDTILTEISKTSDRTATSLKELGDSSFDTASQFGQTAQDYLKGVQEMSRAGFGERESETMAQLSILAQSAGDMTAELANKYLIATNAAYRLGGSVEKLNAVLDSQNYITNHNAVSMEQLAEATRILASQANVSGLGIDEMTAAVSTIITSTQQGGAEVARAFRSILLNLQQVAATTEEIGDNEEAITTESLSKYEAACKDLGVSLKELRDGYWQLRDPMTVLEELSVAFNAESETSIKRINLLNSVGGKLRANALSALLQNFDSYRKMLAEYNSTEAEGSAYGEAMKTAESWQGQINQLKNAWTEFVNTLVNSNLVENALKGITQALQGINSISEKLSKSHLLETFLSVSLFIKAKQTLKDFKLNLNDILVSLVGAQPMLQSNVDLITTAVDNITSLGKGEILGLNWDNVFDGTESNIKQFKLFNSLTVEQKDKLRDLVKERQQIYLQGGDIDDALAKNTEEMQEVANSAKAAGAAFKGFLINIGITAAIAAVAYAVSSLMQRMDEIRESTQKVNNEFIDLRKSMSQSSEDMDGVIEEYANLSQGVDNLGKNVSLTSEEYDRYIDLSNTIAENVPSAVRSWDEKGNAVLRYKGNVEDTTKALQELHEQGIRNQYATFLASEEAKDAFTQFQNGAIFDKRGTNKSLQQQIKSTTFQIASLQRTATLLKEDRIGELDEEDNDNIKKYGSLEEIEKIIRSRQAYLAELKIEADAGIKSMQNLAVSALYATEEYYDLNEQAQSIATNIVSNLNGDTANSFKGIGDIQLYAQNVIKAVEEATPDVQEAFDRLTAFDINDYDNIQEAREAVDKYVKDIRTYLVNNKLIIGSGNNIAHDIFGLDNFDGIYDEYTALINKIEKKYKVSFDEANAAINNLGIKDSTGLIKLSQMVGLYDNLDEAVQAYTKSLNQQAQDTAKVVKTEEELQTDYDNLTKTVKAYSTNQKTLNSALKEQSENGELSQSTIQSLIEAGYQNAIVIDDTTGKITLNNNALNLLNKAKYEEIKLDIEKKKADITTSIQAEATARSELAREMVTANNERRKEIALEMAAIDARINGYEGLKESYDNYLASLGAPADFGTSTTPKSSSTTDAWKKEFDDMYADWQHKLKMGQASEADYIAWLESAYQKYFADKTKYLTEWNKYEEEVYDYRQSKQEEQFDKDIERFKKLADNALDKGVDGNGNAFSNIEERYTYAVNQIQNAIALTQERINQLKLIPDSDKEIESLEKSLEGYNDELINISKKVIQSERDAFEKLTDSYEDYVDEMEDSIKESQEADKKYFEDQIDLIDKQIDEIEKQEKAIKKKNEEEEKTKKLLEAQKELREAERATTKADMPTRLVYENGGFVAKRDEEAFQEALTNQKKAKENLEELQKTDEQELLELQKEALEERKKEIQEQKEANAQYYSSVLENFDKEQEDLSKIANAVNSLYGYFTGDTLDNAPNKDIGLALANMSDKDKKALLENGIVKQDENGEYSLDYNTLGRMFSTSEKGKVPILENGNSIFNSLLSLASASPTFSEYLKRNVSYPTSSDLTNINKTTSPNASNTRIVNNNATPTITINIAGNADKSTISQMKTMLTQTLTDYTNRVTAAMNSAFTKTATVV